MSRAVRSLVAAIAAPVVLATSLAATTGPADATVRNCAASHKNSGGSGSATCLTVYGVSLFIHRTTVSHSHVGRWGQVCNFKADNWGTRENGSLYYKVSPIRSGCAGAAEPIVHLDLQTSFKHNTYFYGQFYHDGAWAPGVAKVLITRDT